MPRRPLLIAMVATLIGLVIGGASLTTAAPPTPSPTNEVGNVKIEGLVGEGLGGVIEIRSFDFHVTRAAGGGGGGGGVGGGGKPVFRTMDIIAYIDRASPGLLKRLTLGSPIKTVTISLTGGIQGGSSVYKEYTLSDVMVVSLREYAGGFDADIPSVEISFAFAKIHVQYTREDAKGGIDRTKFCFNLAASRECPS